jgi:methylase of polypeptide subunit release factors
MLTISKATAYNWKKLKSSSLGKLTTRANKTESVKHVKAYGYVDNEKANILLDTVSKLPFPIECIMFSLVISLLTGKQLIQKAHVQKFLNKYQGLDYIDIPVPDGIWDSHEDILGFIYQSLITEGERNVTGQYYTNNKVVEYMLDHKIIANGETFLDPCCGSGAFLLGVSTNNPENLYGFDINPIAVMIASANLLAKYSDVEFIPRVYCIDFLKKDLSENERQGIPFKFDNIYTNPPWGSDKGGVYTDNFPLVKSKERASMFLVEALSRLNESGTLYFLLPTSLLKIKTHRDIRKYILTSAAIQQIDLYNKRFDGVFTDFFSIKIIPNRVAKQSYRVTNEENRTDIQLSDADCHSGNIVVEDMNDLDKSIIRKMESSKHDDLTHSQWALGIVTGDNKKKVKKEIKPGLEPVYSGKHVKPFFLEETAAYILFEPETFQQCAKTEYFRAPEKLIYRFIAKYPIVAYDDRQCLCLNSANILIPDIDGIAVKSVAALLNSTLYHYYYSMKFSDIKVLKGNLQALPFPKLTPEQDCELSDLVTTLLSEGYSNEYQQRLDKAVFSIFGITPTEQVYIYSKL